MDIIEAGFPAASEGDYRSVREIAAEWFECPVEELTPDVSYGLSEWGVKKGKYESLHRFAVLQRMAVADRKLPWFRRGLRPSSLFPATSLVCSALIGLWLAGALPYHQEPPDALAVVSMVFDSSTLSLGGPQ